MKRPLLFFLRIHPANFPVAWVANLLFFKVVYWRSRLIPLQWLRQFQLLDITHHVYSDEWHLVAEEAYKSFIGFKSLLTSRESIDCEIRGLKINLKPAWIQWLAIQYDEHFKFNKAVKHYLAEQPERQASSRVADTMLYRWQKQFLVELPDFDIPRVKLFALLDRAWYWLFSFLMFGKNLKRLFSFRKGAFRIKKNQARRIRFFLSGFGEYELAEKDGKLNFAFLTDRNLISPENSVFILPNTISDQMRAKLKEKNILWLNAGRVSSALTFAMKCGALKEWFLILLSGWFQFRSRPAAPVLQCAAFDMVPWVYLSEHLKPEAFISTVSAAWPEENAVMVMNARRIRTINWWYSANNLAITNKHKDFKGAFLEYSLWMACEVWVWSDFVKDWLLRRYISLADHEVAFQSIGPVMCGDYRFLLKNAREARKSFGITENPGDCFIVVFDVAPPSLYCETTMDLGGGPIYTRAMSQKFYEDIARLLNEFPGLRLILKPKRAVGHWAKNYPASFLSLIENKNLLKSGRVILVEHDTDPYLTVSLADRMVGLPFTSPVLFGLRAGNHLLFYDPLSTFHYCYPDSLMPFVKRGYKELAGEVKKWFSDSVQERNASFFASQAQREECLWYHLGPEGDPAVRFAQLLHVEKDHNFIRKSISYPARSTKTESAVSL